MMMRNHSCSIGFRKLGSAPKFNRKTVVGSVARESVHDIIRKRHKHPIKKHPIRELCIVFLSYSDLIQASIF